MGNESISLCLKMANEAFGESFKPAKEVVSGTRALSRLDVFVWSDEPYIVERSSDYCGVVRCLDGSIASNRWYWDYNNEKMHLIGSITEEAFQSII